MAITAFLSRSPGLLNRGPGTWSPFQHLRSNWSEALNSNFLIGGPEPPPLCLVLVLSTASYLQLIWCSELQLLNRGSWGPPLLGAGSLYRILSPTHLNFLSPGLYNNLTFTLLPSSVTISHSIQPVHGKGYILIILDQMHLLFTQVHFLFWQLGQVGGQYTTQQSSNLKYSISGQSFCQRDVSFWSPTLDSVNKRLKWWQLKTVCKQ